MLKRKCQISSVNLNSFSLEIPPFQRQLNLSHVDSIYEKAMMYISIGTVPPFPPISVARYPVNILGMSVFKFYIIDGQHRYETYMRLYRNGTIFDVDIHVTFCDSIEEAEGLYKMFNTRMEHSQIEVSNPSGITPLDKEIQDFLYKHGDVFSHKSNAQRPKVRIPSFIDKYMASKVRLTIKSLEDFQKYLRDMNNSKDEEYSKMSRADLCYKFKITDSIITKAKELNFYLGYSMDLYWVV